MVEFMRLVCCLKFETVKKVTPRPMGGSGVVEVRGSIIRPLGRYDRSGGGGLGRFGEVFAVVVEVSKFMRLFEDIGIEIDAGTIQSSRDEDGVVIFRGDRRPAGGGAAIRANPVSFVAANFINDAGEGWEFGIKNGMIKSVEMVSLESDKLAIRGGDGKGNSCLFEKVGNDGLVGTVDGDGQDVFHGFFRFSVLFFFLENGKPRPPRWEAGL